MILGAKNVNFIHPRWMNKSPFLRWTMQYCTKPSGLACAPGTKQEIAHFTEASTTAVTKSNGLSAYQLEFHLGQRWMGRTDNCFHCRNHLTEVAIETWFQKLVKFSQSFSFTTHRVKLDAYVSAYWYDTPRCVYYLLYCYFQHVQNAGWV